MNKVPQLLLIGALLCALSACQDASVMHPEGVGTTSDLVGQWSGSIGTGSMEITFRTQDKAIHGTVTLNFGEGPITYEFDGIEWFSPHEFRIKLPCTHVCERVLIGHTGDGSTLRGSYSEEYSLAEDNVYHPWAAAKNATEPIGPYRLN